MESDNIKFMKEKITWFTAFSGISLIFFYLFAYSTFLKHRFEYIIIHHTAFDEGGYEKIMEVQKKRHPRWREPAYHLILSNGTDGLPPGYLVATPRYRWLRESVATRNEECNRKGVHLCVVGNYQEHPVPDALKPAIGHAVRLLQKKYGIPDERILFHRDCNPTWCPGRFITKEELLTWVHELAEMCPEEIKKEQRRVINFTWISVIKYAGIVLVLISLALWVIESATGKRSLKLSLSPSQARRKS